MSLPVHIVRPGSSILELQRAVVILPVLLDRLHQYQRVPRTVAQLVLRQIGCNGISPRRKFLRAVKAMQVAIHANEHLLYEIFSLLTVANGTIDKVQQTRLISFNELRKCPFLTT